MPAEDKLPELTIEYSKVAGYLINTQKPFAFLHTSNEKTEREIEDVIARFTEWKAKLDAAGLLDFWNGAFGKTPEVAVEDVNEDDNNQPQTEE